MLNQSKPKENHHRETNNFPTDNYIIEGVARQLVGDFEITYVDEPDDIISSIDEEMLP